MLKHPAEASEQTHLGWRTGPAEGADGQDHLLLQHNWQAQASEEGEPLIQFLDPDETAELNEPAPTTNELDFLEVQDAPLESPPFLWSGEDSEPEQDHGPVMFGDNVQADPAKATVFS